MAAAAVTRAAAVAALLASQGGGLLRWQRQSVHPVQALQRLGQAGWGCCAGPVLVQLLGCHMLLLASQARC